MPTVPRITKSVVDSLTCSEGRPAFLWDGALAGFGVKCSPNGAKRYIVKYRAHGGGRSAPQRWLTLGAHGALTPEQARKMAQQALAAVARGEDPQSEKASRRVAPTMTDLWKRFEAERLPMRKPQTQREYISQWSNIVGPNLGMLQVAQVSRAEIDRLHKKLQATPYRANRVLALVSTMMTQAERWDWRLPGSNPCRQIERFKERPRERYLTASELGKIGATIGSQEFARTISVSATNAIQLLLLTGARVSEILGAKWEWVDLDRSVIALPDSKTGSKTLFLSRAAKAVLAQQALHTSSGIFIFPSSGKQGHLMDVRGPWAKICLAAGISGVRIHDLRHTAASIAVGQGASLPIIGRILGHTQAQTTQRYAHVDADPAILAVNALGDFVEGALGGHADGQIGSAKD